MLIGRLQVLLLWLFIIQSSVSAQVYFLVVPEKNTFNRIKEIGGVVWLWTEFRDDPSWSEATYDPSWSKDTDGGVCWWENGKATIVEGTEQNRIHSIEEIGGAVWLATARGAYRWENGKATIVAGTEQKKIHFIGEIGGAVWLATERGAYRWENGKATIVAGTEQKKIYSVREIGGVVWLWSADSWSIAGSGAYRWANGKATIVAGTEQKMIYSVREIGGAVWLDTERGVYWWKNGKATIVAGTEHKEINSIEEIGGAVWIRSNSGAYRWANGKATIVAGTEHKEINSIEEIGGAVWIRSNSGAYRWANGKATIVAGTEHKEINSIKEIGGTAWLATESGAYRWANGKATIVEGTKLKDIYSFEEIDGTVWLATKRGAYRWENGKATIVEGTKNIRSIKEIGGVVWLDTNSGVYWWKNGKATIVEGTEQKMLYSIQEIGGAVWLATEGGAYRWANGKATIVAGTGQKKIYYIQEIGGVVWLDAESGVYRWKNGKATIVAGTDQKKIYSIEEIGGDVWLLTNSGVFTIFPEASISFITPKKSLSGPFTPNFEYKGLEQNVPKQKLQAIISADKTQFQHDKTDPVAFQWVESIKTELKPGSNTFYWCTKDEWGHTYEGESTIWAWPRGKSLAILGFMFWLVLLVVIFFLSPYVIYCHHLLMNPFLRKVGSFGLVPIFISISPFCRRYLLKRYYRAIRLEVNFAQCHDRFIIPTDDFLPERFGVELNLSRALVLHGQSGIGKTSFLQYLAYKYAVGAIDQPKRGIPIFVPLKIYQQSEPEEMVMEQLAKYGHLTDSELNAWLLEVGGFLIFFDGLNEIDDPAKRLAISTFIDRYRLVNFFVVSSQKVYTDLNLKEVAMIRLTREKILEYLQNTPDIKNPAAITADFDASMWALYGVPHNLELGIRNWRTNHRFPTNHKELYGAVLNPIFQRWQEAGEGGYTTTLETHVFRMICNGEHRFDPTKTLPVSIQQTLLENKILVQRNEQILFGHDLVRASLAARYLQREWRDVLRATDLTLNQNWLPMLESLVDELNESETHELVSLVLEKSVALACDLFKHIHDHFPEKCQSWLPDYDAKLGAAVRRKNTRSTVL